MLYLLLSALSPIAIRNKSNALAWIKRTENAAGILNSPSRENNFEKNLVILLLTKPVSSNRIQSPPIVTINNIIAIRTNTTFIGVRSSFIRLLD